jgi:multidrug resistance efflux pump
MIFIGYLITVSLKYWLPLPLRPPVLLIIITGMFYVFYLLIKPNNVFTLSKYLSILFTAIASIIILIQHVIIKFDITYKAAIIISVTMVSPYISGYLYKLFKTK